MGRRILFRHIANFRDLNGFNNASLKPTKEGRVYRSSMLFAHAEEDIQKFQELNISTIFDLRSPKEQDKEPNLFKDKVANYFPINLSKSNNAGRSQELAELHEDPFFMKHRYLEYLEQGADEVRKIFTLFLNPRTFPCVLHCSAGKDRTGTIVYLLLSLHGVPLEEIVADYQVSYTYIKNDKRLIREGYELNVYQSHPEILEQFHQLFSEKFGTAQNYLKQIGFTVEEIQDLGSLLL